MQPFAALEALTAADHVAGHSSDLETQVEGQGSIDDLLPAPAHRQQLVSPPAPRSPPPWSQNRPTSPKQTRAAKLMDDAGRVWLKKRVTLLAHGMSTKLVEATMIAMAYDAVREALVSQEVEVHEVWAWSNC